MAEKNCTLCGREIKKEPFAPDWMLGHRFCDKICAEKMYNERKESVLSSLSAITRKYTP